MKKKIKTLLLLLSKRDIKKIFRIIRIRISKGMYSLRSRIEDWRLGRVSVDGIIQSKYKDMGVTWTQSTDYRLLDCVFKTYPLKKDDIFVDVGCGEGRVLTYLYLRHIKNEMIGIELDSDVAETAKKRTEKCENIEILCKNVFDCSDVIKKATAIYIFNPFNETVLLPFIEMIEKHCHHKVTFYYLNDIHRKYLDKRTKWRIVRRGLVDRPGELPFHYTVFRYLPDADY